MKIWVVKKMHVCPKVGIFDTNEKAFMFKQKAFEHFNSESKRMENESKQYFDTIERTNTSVDFFNKKDHNDWFYSLSINETDLNMM